MPLRWICSLIASLLVLGASPCADAMEAMAFQHLTVDSGLAQSDVRAVFQDTQGFMWFGTEAGLDRFDGYDFRHFTRDSDGDKGLAGDYVYAIKGDSAGNLWIVLKNAGLALFDPHTEKFKTFRHVEGDTTSLESDAVRDVFVDHAGTVWVALTGGGVDILDPRSGIARHFKHSDADPQSLANNRVNALVEDRSGRMWFATDQGLDRWEGEGHFHHFKHTPSDTSTIAGDRVYSLYVDRSGALWVGTGDAGLSQYLGDDRGFRSFTADTHDLSRLNNPQIRTMLEDSAGRFWVGTSQGLHLMDREHGTFTRYLHDTTDPTSLQDDYITALYQDRGGEIWVGTREAGVSRWNPRSWLFGFVRPTWNATVHASTFAEAGGGRLWIGTLGEGLLLYDPTRGETTSAANLFHVPFADSQVLALLRASNGDLWVGFKGGELLRISPSGTITPIPLHETEKEDLSYGVFHLAEARDGRIWAGTLSRGLIIVDPRSLMVSSVALGTGASPLVMSIVCGAGNSLWVGTDGGGLFAFDEKGQEIGTWRHSNDHSSLASDSIYAMTLDSKGRLWVGTSNAGLDKLEGDPHTPSHIHVQHFTTSEGLASNIIYGVQTDAQDSLWLSGNHGLTHFDPTTHQAQFFHHYSGLQGEEFNAEADLKLTDGRLIFAGANGFNIFDPKAVTSFKKSAPQLALTSIGIRGEPMKHEVPYAFIKDLALGYRDDVASFEFSALDFSSPEKNQFSYRLRGFEQAWVPASAQHRATYTNLDAGSYVFEVRGASADGTWSDQTISIPLTVAPAPWYSKPAYVLYGTLFLSSLWALWARQQRKLHLASEQAVKLERVVKERTAELSESNAELARLSRVKSDFLARMSHEIRTPMNGIIGMGELLLRSGLNAPQARLAATVHSSAQSLMYILNDTLDLSKVEAGHFELDSQPFDLADLMTETAEMFAAQAQTKGVELLLEPAADLEVQVVGDALRLRQVLLNLVGNALKFTATGEITLGAQLKARSSDSVSVILSVRDTGNGMTPAVLARIFEPFNQGDESTTRKYGGTGLGLTICKELTQLMGGTVTATSEVGVGSTFSVELSLGVGAVLPKLEARHELVLVTRSEPVRNSIARQCELLGVQFTCASPDNSAAALVPILLYSQGLILVDVDSCASELPSLRSVMTDPALASRLRFFGISTILSGLNILDGLPKPLGPRAIRDAFEGRRTEREAPSTAEVGRLCGHVLIVEDNPVNVAVFEGMLAELGCTYTSATGREAVVLAVAKEYSAILMDVQMPDIDGWAATEMIRRAEKSRRTPIIALTADASQVHKARCTEAGMDGFLAKPLTLPELYQMLARYLPAGLAEQAPGNGALDADTLARISQLEKGGTGGIFTRVATLFIKNSERQVRTIEAAHAQGDFSTVASECHSLKSAAAHVGAQALSRLVLQLEVAVHSSNFDEMSALTKQVAAAQTAASEALQQELMRRAA